MRVVVDANIIFSGILNANGKIGDLLINSLDYFEFIAPDFLRTEIFRHYPKLSSISGMLEEQIREAEFQICKDIKFISEEQIMPSIWSDAEKIVADIDPKDTHYIAYSKHFDCKLWSGDKQLMNGLIAKGFDLVIATDELFNLRAKLSEN